MTPGDRSPTVGDEYQDDLYNCARTYASISVFSSGRSPEVITELLRCAPSSVALMGEPVGRQGRQRNHNLWKLSSKEHVVSKDARRHIDWLLDSVDETELLSLLQQPATNANAWVFWEKATFGGGGPVISPAQMSRLGSLGIPLILDVYLPSEDE